MTRKWLVIFVLLLVILLVLLERREKTLNKTADGKLQVVVLSPKEKLWVAPDSNSIPRDEYGDLIRYGKKLISHTARYIGPRGSINQNANGMNCQNCHLDAGTRAWAGNFGAVASIYPRFSDRRGSFERSMNGKAPYSSSREMKAMNAYISWLGIAVPKGKKPAGAGLEMLKFI